MIAGLIARARSLWRGLRRRSNVEAEMTEEFRLHVELRAADLVRSGLSPAEATRRARLEFGHMESFMQKGRTSRGLGPFDGLRVSLLDFKLGFRMLVKYPGLTLVAGFAFAFAIWAGAGAFEFLTQVVHPTLPLDEGDRIVALRNWHATAGRPRAPALHDFVTWREELESVEDLGAYRTLECNLILDNAVMPLNEVINSTLKLYGFWFRLTLVVSSIALLLSLAGIYAVMSFTVARRTREIGVRVALGADPRRIVAAIFRRPLTQVALGVVAGGVLVAAIMIGPDGDALSARQVGMVVAYAALMFAVCMLACIVPTRRALRIQPTEALTADG